MVIFSSIGPYVYVYGFIVLVGYLIWHRLALPFLYTFLLFGCWDGVFCLLQIMRLICIFTYGGYVDGLPFFVLKLVNITC